MIYGEIFDILQAAVIACMKAVRPYMLGEKKFKKAAEVKGLDRTLVTVADRESGEAAFPILCQLPLNYDIQPEDSRGRTTPGARFVVWLDNIDGTRSLVNGLKSPTVILAIYDRILKKVVFCMILDLDSGEIRYASLPVVDSEEPTSWVIRVSGNVEQIKVCANPLDSQATVFFDAFEEGFPLSSDQYCELFRRVTKLGANPENPKGGVHVVIPGSNGRNLALVANGWEGAVGGIVTAKGGPWDAAGVLLVLMAGGAARAFNLREDGLVDEADPLDPTSYNLLVYGNSRETVDMLTVQALAPVLKD